MVRAGTNQSEARGFEATSGRVLASFVRRAMGGLRRLRAPRPGPPPPPTARAPTWAPERAPRTRAKGGKREGSWGPRTTDHGPRTTDHGPRTTDHRRLTTVQRAEFGRGVPGDDGPSRVGRPAKRGK